MNFIMGLPKSKKHNDSIFVVVNKLSKEAHFIPLISTYKAVHIADIFLKEIFRLHQIPKETSQIEIQNLPVISRDIYSLD